MLAQRSLGVLELEREVAAVGLAAAVGERTLVTCITKSSAEALSSFLNSHGVASLALHSGVKPLERLRFAMILYSRVHGSFMM